MGSILLFLYCWCVVFFIRISSVNMAKMLADRIAIIELKTIVKKNVHNVSNHICLSDYFDDMNFIFNPNYFDKWTPKHFLRFVIEKRINDGKDIIFNNSDIYKDVL